MGLVRGARGLGVRDGKASVLPGSSRAGLAHAIPPLAQVWDAVDYAAPDVAAEAVEDHWRPMPVRSAAARPAAVPGPPATAGIGGASAVVDPPAALAPPGPADDFWGFDAGAVPLVPAGAWAGEADADLPFYDPTATAAPAVAEVFAGAHVWRVGTRAGLLALATAIPHAHGRALAARAFEDALQEARWPNFFRSWLRLAPSLECPRVIALAIEVREQWDDSPHLWRFRDAQGRMPRQHGSARGQMSWRRALAMAEARPHEPAWRLLDEDHAAEWNELDQPCPGFWSLAEWLEIACCGDEADVHAMGVAAMIGRHRRALHLQDMCERLGLGRTGSSGGDGRSPLVEQEVANFHHRGGHLRPGAGAVVVERRAPTVDEMEAREVE